MKNLVYIFLGLFIAAVLSAPAMGIDKKRDPSPKKDTPTVEKKTPDRSRSVDDSKTTKVKTRKKNYDDFVDRNNNGIDDRAEKSSTPKKPEKPDTRKKPEPEKPKP
jgi:hypothetical protein